MTSRATNPRAEAILRDPSGRAVLVVGLGRSGCAAARYLLARGAAVTATDLRRLEELSREVAVLGDAGVSLVLAGHDPAIFAAAELIVLSPGVPLSLPELTAPRAAGVPILSEIDLVAERVTGRAIAITGSNGKSTATALTAAFLAAAGREGVPSGNWGVPLTDAIRDDRPERWYALEISSFQLEATQRLRAAASVILNVQPDHLDRHGSFEAYLAAKASIAALRAEGAPLVLVVDDPSLAELATRAAGPVLEVSVERPVERGGFLQGTDLVLRGTEGDELFTGLDAMPLPGRHNVQNVLAAAVACRFQGVPAAAMRSALSSFRGLPHRMHTVATVHGIRFVDDSKATNVGAAIEAIRAFATEAAPGPLIVLLGGRDKAADFAPLAAALAHANAAAVTFGEAGPTIAAVLEREGTPPEARARSLEEATRRAAAQAGQAGVVLLAPACASFDEFKSYAERGERFASYVRALDAEEKP